MKHITIIKPKDSVVDKLLRKFNIKRKIIVSDKKTFKNIDYAVLYGKKENLIICLIRYFKEKFLKLEKDLNEKL